MIEQELNKLEACFGIMSATQREQLRSAFANYGLTCCFDSYIRKEAEEICAKEVGARNVASQTTNGCNSRPVAS